MIGRFAIIAAAVAILVALAGCERGDSAAVYHQPADSRPNVLLVVVDTLRADRVGCYGNEEGLTPNIDRLADSGVRFANASSHAPWTLPSFGSLLTSRHPIVHGAGGRLGAFQRLAPNLPTVAETFRNAGYRTGEIINVMFVSKVFGVTRGFEHVDLYDSTNVAMRPAAQTADAAFNWIMSGGDRPYFALVHFFDPHLVYDPPADIRKRVLAAAHEPDIVPTFGTREDMVMLRRGQIRLSEERIRQLAPLYNGEVAYVDRELGRLLDRLREKGALKNTVIVVTADHGEEFYDHGGFEHGHSLYQELLHVPLIFAGKNVPSGVEVKSLVGLIDVAPTLCELTGVATPPEFDGISLAGTMMGKQIEPRPVLSHGNMWGPPLNAMNTGRYKLIRFGARAELYDLETDPAEQHNIAENQRKLTKSLSADMDLLLRTLRTSAHGSATKLILSDEERSRLCALGYLEDCDQ